MRSTPKTTKNVALQNFRTRLWSLHHKHSTKRDALHEELKRLLEQNARIYQIERVESQISVLTDALNDIYLLLRD